MNKVAHIKYEGNNITLTFNPYTMTRAQIKRLKAKRTKGIKYKSGEASIENLELVTSTLADIEDELVTLAWGLQSAGVQAGKLVASDFNKLLEIVEEADFFNEDKKKTG